MTISHPAAAARLMLERKRIEYDLVRVAPGWQAFVVRLAGFRGGTVPALSLAGRRVVGTTRISRFLDELQPDPPLFPLDPQRRRAVEEAEAWGERVLQPIPRRLLRWAVRNDREARVLFMRELGDPRPELTAWLALPATAVYARRENARSVTQIRADWEGLPAHLEHVDELIAAGTIGGPEPNAADFQIATTLRVMLAFEDFEPLMAGRPGEALARRFWPEYRYRWPSLLPAELAGRP